MGCMTHDIRDAELVDKELFKPTRVYLLGGETTEVLAAFTQADIHAALAKQREAIAAMLESISPTNLTVQACVKAVREYRNE